MKGPSGKDSERSNSLFNGSFPIDLAFRNVMLPLKSKKA